MVEDKNQELGMRRPKLLLLAGTTGVGKSVIAQKLCTDSGFQRVISTDSIREILRSTINHLENPALHRSSFSMGASKSAVPDWIDSCEPIEIGIQAVIDRSRREGISLIVEGVHVLPENRNIRRWQAEGGLALGVALHVRSEAGHREMLEQRESETWRNVDRFLAAMERIRAIQDGLLEQCRSHNWHIIDPREKEDAAERIAHLFDLEWNRTIRGS